VKSDFPEMYLLSITVFMLNLISTKLLVHTMPASIAGLLIQQDCENKLYTLSQCNMPFYRNAREIFYIPMQLSTNLSSYYSTTFTIPYLCYADDKSTQTDVPK